MFHIILLLTISSYIPVLPFIPSSLLSFSYPLTGSYCICFGWRCVLLIFPRDQEHSVDTDPVTIYLRWPIASSTEAYAIYSAKDFEAKIKSASDSFLTQSLTLYATVGWKSPCSSGWLIALLLHSLAFWEYRHHHQILFRYGFCLFEWGRCRVRCMPCLVTLYPQLKVRKDKCWCSTYFLFCSKH